MNVNRVWGAASGKCGTSDAARGAFTWREYPIGTPLQRDDWIAILKIEQDVPAHDKSGDTKEQAKHEHTVEDRGSGNKASGPG